MISLNYDFHIHSCLSPCADDDMTPANIVGMAKLCGLDVIAITDHNSCLNAGAAINLGNEAGIIVIPGMELTTKEEVHVVCLFAELTSALAFNDYVYEHLIKVEDTKHFFGRQLIVDEEENIVREEKYLLVNATDIGFSETYDLVSQYNGIMIPAHIDRNSNSVLSQLGFLPQDSKFTCVEIKDMTQSEQIVRLHPYTRQCRIITDSDAHRLWEINEAGSLLAVAAKNPKDILEALSVQ